jgi:hypothetical protein
MSNTNSDVINAFVNKNLRDCKSNNGNLHYYADELSIWSYGLKIGQWDGLKTIVLEQSCSSATTNTHINMLHRALPTFDTIVVSKRNVNYGWGSFPNKEFWYSPLSPNNPKWDYIYKPSMKLSRTKSINVKFAYDYSNWLTGFEVYKSQKGWDFNFMGTTYSLKTISSFREICSYWHMIFPYKTQSFVRDFLFNKISHEHHFKTYDFVQKMHNFLRQNSKRWVLNKDFRVWEYQETE